LLLLPAFRPRRTGALRPALLSVASTLLFVLFSSFSSSLFLPFPPSFPFIRSSSFAAPATASSVSTDVAAHPPSFLQDQTEFIAGQVFDIRIESHAPTNGTQAYKDGVVADDFALYLRGKGASELKEISQFYSIEQPAVEAYNFTVRPLFLSTRPTATTRACTDAFHHRRQYYEDLFAEKAETPTLVNVKARQYQHLTLYKYVHCLLCILPRPSC
jgi:hypothetical protein